MRIRYWQFSIALFTATGLLSGCTGGQAIPSYRAQIHGFAPQGRQIIERYKCGECHTIPGIDNANGVFGPPLNMLGRRTVIAGNFPNEPGYLTHWIMSPEEMKPKTAMPDLGLSEQQARDVAAYLYTLQ